MSMNGMGSLAGLDNSNFRLMAYNRHDIDENSIPRKCGKICSTCRTSCIDRRIRSLLQDCSRGGGRHGGYNNDWSNIAPVIDYIGSSIGTAQTQAEMAVEEVWLKQQTRWKELERYAIDCQIHEAWARILYLRYRESPSSSLKEDKLSYLCELEGIDYFEGGDEDLVEELRVRERMDGSIMRHQWNVEMQEGWTWEDEEDESNGDEVNFWDTYEEPLNERVRCTSTTSILIPREILDTK